jgi:hypothetical protein
MTRFFLSTEGCGSMRLKLAALLSLLSVSAFPVYASQATATAGTSGGFPLRSCSEQSVNALSATASCATPSNAGSTATAQAGVLRLSASTVNSAEASSRASFNESLTLNFGTFFAGKTGTLFGQFVVDGSLGGTASGSDKVPNGGGTNLAFQGGIGNANVNTSGSFDFSTNPGTAIQNKSFDPYLPIAWTFSVDGDGKAGTNISFNAQIRAGSVATDYRETSISPVIPGYATASANFGNTIYWAGIQSLKIEGNEITNYSISSESGFDYRRGYVAAVVSEPETYAMMLAGLGLMGAVTRLRKAKQTP